MQCNRKTIEVEIALLLSATNMCYKDVILGVGASMVMAGVRDLSKHVDVSVSADVYNRLKKEGYEVKKTDEGECIVYNELVTIFRAKPAEVTEIDGFITHTLRYLHSYKIFLMGKRNRSHEHRQSDLADIRKLESMIC